MWQGMRDGISPRPFIPEVGVETGASVGPPLVTSLHKGVPTVVVVVAKGSKVG